MAITRPFGYNPSQNPIPGADSFGTLVVGSDNLDFSQNPGGIKWWMGPDETDGYVISGVVSGGTQPSPVGDIGTVNFWRTGNLTSEKFIQLANKISLQNFTTVGDAVTWLNGNGYWTSYDPLLITPTPSATLPLSPTPAVTPTPTVTPSRTIPPDVLDAYSGSSAAYSLRKVKSNYNGSAIRVRRSSDNAEQDIGFLNGVLDTATLTSFVGSNNGFVTTWYDQSGNNVNLSQSSAANQPRIVNSGNTETVNNKVAIYFDGTSDSMLNSTIYILSATTLSLFQVFKINDSGNFVVNTFNGGYILAGAPGSGSGADFTTILSRYKNSVLTSTTTQGQVFTNYSTNSQILSTQFISYANVIITSFGVSSFPGGWNVTGHYQEIILYPSSQTSNRSGIESDINTYYTIY